MAEKELVVVDSEGNLQNRGAWDFLIVDDVIECNPWTGEGEAPEDWDLQCLSRGIVTNPLPEGFRDEYHKVFFDKHGSLHLERDRPLVEARENLEALNAELKEILEANAFGEATDEQLTRGREIRKILKEV